MPKAGAPTPEVDDMEIKMVLFLPRDAASVPVSRQVLDGCLETLGVTEDTRIDIALALSEACANVVQHARSGPRPGTENASSRWSIAGTEAMRRCLRTQPWGCPRRSRSR